MSTFDRALDMILRLEGGETNDPSDPGGHTRYGISKRAHPDVDIANLTREGAAAIYWSHYWRPLRCDDMVPSVAIAVFDCAVNQGQGAAVKLLQKSARVEVDGVIGLKTLGAVAAKAPAVLVEFMARRALRYMTTANFNIFGRGWLTRLFVVHRESVLLEGKE
jgi:lysozyme family protein